MAKMTNPNRTYWWVPLETVGFDPYIPSAALLTPARNISCAIESGETFNPSSSDTDDTTTICDSANVETPTFYNYEGSATFIREEVGANEDNTSAFYRAFEFFKHKNASGYIVRRLGYLNTVAPAVGQKVEVFKFITDNPSDVVSDSGGPIKFTVPFGQQAVMVRNVALVA